MTPTLTLTPTIQIAQHTDITNFFSNPFVQYILSPVVVFGIIFFILSRIYNFGGFMEKVTKALDNVADLDKKVSKLAEHMGVIKTHLVTSGGLDVGLFGPGSPLKLLPAGIRLLERTGFKKIYHDNKEWFVNEAKNYKHDTISDIDDASFKIMEKCRDGNDFADFKEIAYQNGINLDVLLRALAIYLRDELAKEIISPRT